MDIIVNKNEDQRIVLDKIDDSLVSVALNDNSNLNFIFFSRYERDLKFVIKVGSNCNLNLSYILMNEDSNLNLLIDIDGQNSNVLVKTLQLAKNATKNMDVNIYHNSPNSSSEVINYGISFENGHNNYDIKSRIKEMMSGSNARQITKGIILDKSGSCKVLPILYIDNYDVKAYHGASIGKVQDEDLFYLMSRGLTKREAFMLIVNGLLEPFIKEIEEDNIKEMILNKYQSYFGE